VNAVRTFEFPKIWNISLLAEELVASQGLRSMDLASSLAYWNRLNGENVYYTIIGSKKLFHLWYVRKH
jgi:hypothetical protein